MTRGIAVLLALPLIACGASGDGGETSPSGAQGAVTQEAADEALLGLCEIVTAVDVDEASATFQDRSHRTLHLIAAATEAVDRGAAADLLAAKQRVEAGLAASELPVGFPADVEALVEAAREAVEAIGLAASACEA